MGRYARGRHAVAECQRSGQKMRYRDLVEDGHIPGLLVHPDWWEPKHPQETPPDMTDPIALRRPAPEISIPAGHGDAENLDGGTTPVSPVGSPVTTLATTVSGSETQFVTDTAVTYYIGQWVAVALDGGGEFYSRIVSEVDLPTFVIPFTSPFTGTATAGNNIWIFDA